MTPGASRTGGALILILGDQLSRSLSSLNQADPNRDQIVMVEVAEETAYANHHKKKIALIFAAMRHFAAELRTDGWQVDYVALDDPQNAGSFTAEIERAIKRFGPTKIVVTEPGEWRVRSMMDRWSDRFGLPVEILEDNRFVCTHARYGIWT
ncbi:MAG: cryptochrome/photolyase family protein [Pseudomonadota bacterium]